MEGVLLRSILGFRAFQLVEGIVRIREARADYRHPGLAVASAAAAFAESAWFARRCLRRGDFRDPVTRWADVAATAALGGLSAAALAPADRADRRHWTAAYAIGTVAAATAGAHTWGDTAAATSVLVGAYLAGVTPTLRDNPDARGPVLYNILLYPGFALAVTFIARRLRRSAADLHSARRDAVTQAERAAAQRERLRHHRLVHDSALQTLEALAGLDATDAAAQADVGHRVRREAERLRRVLDGREELPAPGLAEALSALAEDFAAAGLRVELVLEGLDADPAPPAVDALAAAAQTALTRAHAGAGARRAVLRAVSDDGGVRVTVRDHGEGPGLEGAAHDLRVALETGLSPVAGRVELHPGVQGTRVVLWAPVAQPT